MKTSERIAVLEHAYRLFNDRRVDELLALMTDDVEWPDVANGTILHDKVAIRRYWAGQFATASPQVTPTGFMEVGQDLVAVIDQRIMDLKGSPLVPPAVVFHRYTFAGDLVSRMVVFTDREAAFAGE
ncbi:MAG TPA: nuclear transport factor 2 family protein [Acidimicrobiales bacterium]|nr:nuclear transport factor 2 family protein [Acidimicrobiales bacterium]